jgi:molybdate transport system regulatory protein
MDTQPPHRLTIRIDLAPGIRVGPGKIALLDAINTAGSIAGAGRILKMSYKRAWDLVEELNANFTDPLVSKAPGGPNGGGAHLTESGKALVKHYRDIESAAHTAASVPLHAVSRMTKAGG